MEVAAEASKPASRPATPPTEGPPKNFGTVADDENYRIYRSAFPGNVNVDFLKTKNINTVITLVNFESFAIDEGRRGVAQFIEENSIQHVSIPITPNKEKDGTSTSVESICEALIHVINPANYPLYIHCNQGKHRTGCVVACFRKCQGWAIDKIIEEYDVYALGKSRKEDVAFIEAFDTAAVYKYAKEREKLHLFPKERKDSAVSIWDLAPVQDLSPSADNSSEYGVSSEYGIASSDDGL
ncbi:hypothetical protein DOTSEDRAFT_75925 [Lecanosticta acicola]|uniref:Tyrosine phosphatase n=1 Tax=Lecanosticta acicola TaxID=111012 RepID=A0AAI8Z6L8_9PEZI|nr:hypothetical protein DOTSEDRAFT_75925 [Lecanosticta acicola]